jgi:predicted O-linked N-acetylglucosamine transferase (SPINDLY family)
MPPPVSIPQLVQNATQHHQAGRLREAAGLYREILSIQPKNADVLHYLGVLELQAGHFEIAADFIQQALAVKPQFAQAFNNLGTAFKELGRFDQAVSAYRQAIVLKPASAPAHSNLGIVLKKQGLLDQAIAAFRQAIALQPKFSDAYYNLANALEDHDDLQEAVTAFRRAIALNPYFPQAFSNLGAVLGKLGRMVEAAAAYRQAVALNPQNALALANMGHVLCELRQYAQAESACRRALALEPRLHLAHNNLGNVLLAQGQQHQAVAAYRQAVALAPDFATAHSNLGNVLKEIEQLDEAVASCRLAITLEPGLPEAHYNMANALKYVGFADEALDAYRRALALRPDFREAHGNLLFYTHYHPAFTPRTILQEHQTWADRHARSFLQKILPHENERSPDRRLKIGYVSPDFYQQAESFFTMPLLEHHDHAQCEIHCYSSARKTDAVTERLRASADHWHDVRQETDETLAEHIRNDRIDILIDLTMHMADNRALVFARKPAPIQVCWLAYPGTTGLPTMDYRLTDSILDPPDADVSCYTEESLRLPEGWVVYDPLDDVPARPAAPSGPVTFGSFNNQAKLNPPLLQLWARVLQSVPDSRMILQVTSPGFRRRIRELVSGMGVDAARLSFVGRMDRLSYLRAYDQIDIALDPLPYNGITTTCDALYMGVPVLTLKGATACGRAGQSILSCLGLDDWVTYTPQQFLERAIQFASNPAALVELRSTLRERMEQSPLMDAPAFTRAIESAFRRMWHQWCLTSVPAKCPIRP